MALKSSAAFRAPHHSSWLVPWLGQVPPEGSPRRQLHLQSQHIIDTSIMLLLIFVDHLKIHTLCLVKPLVHKRDVGICRVKLLPQSGKLSSSASHRTLSRLHMKAARSLPGTMILCLPPLDSNQSLRGYYLHRAHLARAVPSKNIYYFPYLKAS